MVLQTGQGEEAREATQPVTVSARLADEMISRALEFSRRRVASDEETVTLLRRNYAPAHEYFRYGVALQVARHVAAVFPTLKGVYLFNPEEQQDDVEGPPASLTSPVCLLFWTERDGAAVDGLLADLGAALTVRYRVLVAPRADGLHSLLDVAVVNDEAVRRGIGSACLLCSSRERPIPVWERGEA